ncbi:BTB And Kelch [Cooperia oncophora]
MVRLVRISNYTGGHIIEAFTCRTCAVTFSRGNWILSNCLAIRTIADTYSCQNLLKWADMYIVRNFQEVSGKEEFNQLSVERLVDLISHEDLNVRSEEQVCKYTFQKI